MLDIGSYVDGKYKILNKIGRGGMSVVYLAMNEKANKQWAIKEVRKDGKQDFEIVKQGLIVETDMLKKLNHPNLPSIVDVIDDKDTFLIVMDYIEGNPLSNYLEEHGAQSQSDTVKWAKQLCDVLDYLHHQDPPIIYRDMKPANIMLKPNGDVTLIDFGIAREYKEGNIEDTTCLGTQGYAAPEQFGGKGQTDGRTDIYNLGATMYHLVTGHNPAKPPYEMYPITHWDPTLSTGLEQIILKCTKKNPEDRYQDCNELMYALEHYNELDIEYKKKQKKKFVTFAGTFAASLVLFGVSAFGFVNEKSLRLNTYENNVEAAGRATNVDEVKSQVETAVRLDSSRADAYIAMLDYFRSDGLFDAETEEPYIRSLLNSTTSGGVTNAKSMEADAAGFADFAYKLGAAYWYDYGTMENGEPVFKSQKQQATNWFKAVKEVTAPDGSTNYREFNNAQTYAKIGDYYEKLEQVDKLGDSEVTYSDFWVDLKNLYNSDVANSKTKLYIYKDIVTSVANYAHRFAQDGVTKDEIDAVINEISKTISETSTDVSNDSLIKSISETIPTAQSAMEAAYSKTSSEGDAGEGDEK
ncbi:MAG: serine/threonine protein kinase [Lachnospiraceae bacterium]|nr:serine/threonine protein kinase [Lachnospiraceae bacterium]